MVPIFDEMAGYLYIVPLLVLPLIHGFVIKLLKPLASVAAANVVLLAGALVALLAYQRLHFSYWDEHSLLQAIELSLLGVLSYLASVVASIRLAAWQGNHRQASASAWLILGLSWMLAYYYPMIALFVMAVVLALAGIWSVVGSVDVESVLYKKTKSARPVKYLLFLLMVDLGLVIWDYQVDTAWAWHLGGAMLTATIGCWLAFESVNKFQRLIMIVIVINFIAAIIWPVFILHHLHSALIGLSLGWSIGYLVNSQGAPKPLVVVSAAMPVFLGLAVGYLVYANLVYAFGRVVFLVPLLVLWFLASRKTASSKVVAN
ncbi:hypothetical protein [Kaarinaea lacus]